MNRLSLTGRQRRQLRRQLERTDDLLLYRRTLALLEVDRGRSVAEVAGMLRVTRQAIYNWIDNYARTGEPTALLDGRRSGRVGRPSLWTDALQAALGEMLATSPDRLGYFAVEWTVPLLQEHLERGTGRRLSDETIRRRLRRLGYVWKRPRYVLDPDPEVEKKTADSPPGRPPAAPQRRARRR